MANWENVELGSICEVVRGGSPRPIIDYITDEPDGVNWLKIGDVKETDKFFTHANEKIKPSGIPKTREVKAGDLILSNSMSFGRAFITLIDGYIHDGWLRLRCDESKLDKEYLYYFLTSNLAQNQFKAIATGSVVNNLKSDTVKAVKIALPTLGEQKRIAEVLSMFDDKIKCNEEVNKNLLQQAQSIFTQEFLMFDRIPDGWQESSLLGIADYLNGLAMQKYRPVEGEQGLPVLKIKELRQGSCDANSDLCSPSIKPEYIVHDGDVIFSWSGSLLVDLWCGGTCGLNQHLFKVTSETYDKWFYYAWTNYHLQKFAAIAADMATTMGHIKREELSKAEVLIPSRSDYERIGSLLAPLYDLVISNRIENRKLATLRDELLPQLMTGRLDVSEVSL